MPGVGEGIKVSSIEGKGVQTSTLQLGGTEEQDQEGGEEPPREPGQESRVQHEKEGTQGCGGRWWSFLGEGHQALNVVK